jgi:Protein of unknown function (DUF3617)
LFGTRKAKNVPRRGCPYPYRADDNSLKAQGPNPNGVGADSEREQESGGRSGALDLGLFSATGALTVKSYLLFASLSFFAIQDSPSPRASETMPARLYEVITETGMPHLEENLRYTTTREKVCLAHQALAAAFPILDHPALRGCSLQNETRRGDTISYTLACTGGHETMGEATWHVEERWIQGTLNIKLGGKNMTFYQRVTAQPLGSCPAATQ